METALNKLVPQVTESFYMRAITLHALYSSLHSHAVFLYSHQLRHDI